MTGGGIGATESSSSICPRIRAMIFVPVERLSDELRQAAAVIRFENVVGRRRVSRRIREQPVATRPPPWVFGGPRRNGAST